jgi:hypothetical protein
MPHSWRDSARPVIAAVLRAMEGKPEKEIRAALKAAYPFGMRKYHPYKVWLDEIKKQRGAVAKPHPDQILISEVYGTITIE